MDFDKIKPAVEEIRLSGKQKEDILNACKGKKKKFNFKPLATVAAVLVLTFGFFTMRVAFLGAKSADSSSRLELDEVFGDIAETGDSDINQSASTFLNKRPIYFVVPTAFSDLVDEAEFSLWQSRASAENGMLIAQFAEYFNISKEDFEKANAAYALQIEEIYGEKAQVDPPQGKEYLEIFNSDIIYSFDKTVTDNYYSKK